MEKTKRIILRCIFLLILLFLIYLVLTSCFAGIGGEDIASLPAEMIVNGERLGMTAKVYWYGGKAHMGASRAECPFLMVLESLGCSIEGDEQTDPISIRIKAGYREFVLSSDSLYERGNVLVAHAVVQYSFRSKTIYLQAEKVQEVLAALGFEQISCNVDDEAMEIRLSAVPGWSK